MRVENLAFQTTSNSKATSSTTTSTMPYILLGESELPTPSNKKS
jgi:hypothetical protein